MTEQRTISICIPSYNRVEMTLESFAKVYDDERVSEIVIVDDASDWGIFTELKNEVEKYPKVKLYRNLTNQDCFRNKMTAVSYATNDWCVLLDSDNVIGVDYLDKIFAIQKWDSETIYTPDFAEPNFNFTAFSGMAFIKENIAEFIDKPMFETMLNASNYFLNKTEWLRVWDGSTDPVTSDSIYTVYNWLAAGNVIEVVDGLRYFHRVHSGSHYQNNKDRTPHGFHEEILTKIKQLT